MRTARSTGEHNTGHKDENNSHISCASLTRTPRSRFQVLDSTVACRRIAHRRDPSLRHPIVWYERTLGLIYHKSVRISLEFVYRSGASRPCQPSFMTYFTVQWHLGYRFVVWGTNLCMVPCPIELAASAVLRRPHWHAINGEVGRLYAYSQLPLQERRIVFEVLGFSQPKKLHSSEDRKYGY